jgi:hypothetical protein
MNQYECSLIISDSSSKAPLIIGAVTVTVKVTLPPGRTSFGNEKAWLVLQ